MSPKNVVKSAARVLEVLELFAHQRTAMSGTEICNALDYPKSSANAILKCLVELGYLALNPDNLKYFPSLRVNYLGDWLPEQLLGNIETTKLLESLHQATGETVTLSMLNGFHMQFIRVLPGTFPLSLRVSEGFMPPIFGTAVGSAYLSTISNDAIRDLLLTPPVTSGCERRDKVAPQVSLGRVAMNQNDRSPVSRTFIDIMHLTIA